MSRQTGVTEPPPVTMTMEDLLHTFDWDTYIAEFGNEGFTPLPVLGREQLAASPDEVEPLVEFNPGSSPSEDSSRYYLQATGASLRQGYSQIEQELSQNLHSGSLEFNGNIYHFDNNHSEFSHQAIASNAPVLEGHHSSPSHAADDDEQLNLAVEESFRLARERHLGEGEWELDEDGVWGEQSKSPVQWSPASGQHQEHLDRQGLSPNKGKKPNEAVEKRTCKLCGAVLSHACSLKGHYAQHLSNPQYLTPEQILTAEQCCRGNPLYRCSQCPMLSDRQATVYVHERLHEEGSSVTKCTICEVVLTSRYIRKEHMSRHHTDWHNTFMRDGCHRSETTYNEEDDDDFNHSCIDPAVGLVENESRGVYECRLCAARLVTRYFRRVHYKAHRVCADKEGEEEGADVKSKKGKVKEQRKSSNVGLPRFQCRQCTATLKSKYLFDKHRAGHLAEEMRDGGDVQSENVAQAVQGRFKCKTCQESFKNRYFLQKHYRVHLKNKERAILNKTTLDSPAWGEFQREEPCNAEPQTYNDRSKHAKMGVSSSSDIGLN